MFIPPIFSFFRNSQILIPQHFPPSIKFSNLPIKSFHYKSHHPLSADFVFVVFTLRIIQLGNSALQNRGDPVTVEFFRMEQWMVAQKGWRYIYIYREEGFAWEESQRFLARYFRSIENALSLDCRWHCFSRCCPIEPLTKTLFNLI